MPVPSQGNCGFHSFLVVDWFCLFIYLWVLTFPLLDCSEFGNFVITLICIWYCESIFIRWQQFSWFLQNALIHGFWIPGFKQSMGKLYFVKILIFVVWLKHEIHENYKPMINNRFHSSFVLDKMCLFSLQIKKIHYSLIVQCLRSDILQIITFLQTLRSFIFSFTPIPWIIIIIIINSLFIEGYTV